MIKKLRKKFINNCKEEQGAVAIIMALCMTALLSFGALATDMGLAYVEASEAQTAADMAALAAGELLPVSTASASQQSDVIAEAQEYLAKNDFTDPTEFTISLGTIKNDNYTSIDVDINTSSETNFAKVMGIDSIDLHRGATVVMLNVTAANGVVPISIETEALATFLAGDPSQSVILKYGTNTDAVVNGAFGALDVDGGGGGASDYEEWLAFGYSGTLHVGDEIPVETGNMTGPTYSGINTRYYGCTHYASQGGCTADHYVSTCSRVMVVPVVTYTDKHDVIIDSFAIFILEDIETYADQGAVIGRYLTTVINDAYGDTTGLVNDFGAYTLELTR